MSSILREWLVRQSSPDTRKLSARPAGKPGDFLHVLENLRRSPPRHSLARPKAPACVWKAWRNLSGPMWFANQNQTLRRSRAASRWSAPGPGSRTCREDHAPSHRPQMSSGRLFLDRVARQQCPSPLHRHQQHNIHSSSDQAKGDISILPARGHFYFALTAGFRELTRQRLWAIVLARNGVHMSMVFAPEQDMATRLWFYQAEEICLHSFRYSAGKVECLPHTHDEYNIVICLAGEIDCVIAEDHQTLSPGEVLVVNPGEVHYASYPKEPVAAVGITLHVPESAMHRTIRRMRLPLDLEASSLSFVGKAKDPALLQFADELIAELDERQNGFEMVTQALVIQLIVHLLRRCLSPVVHTPRRVLPRQLPSWQMVRAFEYMNAC